jgi:hypothetical protein
MRSGRRWLAVLALALLPFGPARGASGADSQFLALTLAPGQTIRDIAEKYLGDPDLWPEILKTSGIASIADLHPGMDLKIPVTEVSAANKAILESLGQIQKANEAGAQLFAPDEIGQAIGFQEQALQKRIERAWLATRDLAVSAFGQATAAIAKSESERDRSGEALVSDRNGEVEGQRPEDLSWRGLELRAILIEEEKVRTLSDSTAQITFRDASRLRLSANSNAIIKEMKFDPLKQTEEAKVTLVEGDFYALLASGNERAKFNVDIPQVNATIDSGDFWVSNGKDSAKFTNYDDKTVKVAANGESVTLDKNEGTVVGKGEKPMGKVAVLRAPLPSTPADKGFVYVTTPEVAWSPVEDSAGYWLEIASDQGFERIVANFFGLDGTKKTIDALPVGEYFWRVSALDGFGLPGARSATFSFKVTPDDTPPYLTIDKPGEGAILRQASVEIAGESEPGATVLVAGVAVPVDADGRFSATVKLSEGANAVTVVAKDIAGNATSRDRRFTYMADKQSVVVFDPGIRQIAPLHFVTNGNVVSLNGKTIANAALEIRAGDQLLASAVSGADGLFRLNVPLAADEMTLAVAVIASSGFTTVADFAVTIDRVAPEIALNELLPQLTSEPALKVAGKTEPGARLALNGKEVALKDGAFDASVTLEPGDNVIELTAADIAGNVTVEKSTVKLDREPPQLVSSRATPVAGKAVLALEVVASDTSGLAKAAPFTVLAGGQRYTGYLRYNRAARTYQGTLVLPAEALAGARLSQVGLEDDAGNTKSFTLQ